MLSTGKAFVFVAFVFVAFVFATPAAAQEGQNTTVVGGLVRAAGVNGWFGSGDIGVYTLPDYPAVRVTAVGRLVTVGIDNILSPGEEIASVYGIGFGPGVRIGRRVQALAYMLFGYARGTLTGTSTTISVTGWDAGAGIAYVMDSGLIVQATAESGGAVAFGGGVSF